MTNKSALTKNHDLVHLPPKVQGLFNGRLYIEVKIQGRQNQGKVTTIGLCEDSTIINIVWQFLLKIETLF